MGDFIELRSNLSDLWVIAVIILEKHFRILGHFAQYDVLLHNDMKMHLI